MQEFLIKCICFLPFCVFYSIKIYKLEIYNLAYSIFKRSPFISHLIQGFILCIFFCILYRYETQYKLCKQDCLIFVQKMYFDETLFCFVYIELETLITYLFCIQFIWLYICWAGVTAQFDIHCLSYMLLYIMYIICRYLCKYYGYQLYLFL